MDGLESGFGEQSRLKALLLDHFSVIEDLRPSHKVAYPLSEVLLLAVCGTIADCDSYDAIGLWGDRHLDFFAAIIAISSWCSDWPVADVVDEPDRSMVVFSLLYGLGPRLLAGSAGVFSNRWQDLAAKP